MSLLSALQSTGLENVKSIKFNVCDGRHPDLRSIPLLRYMVLQCSKLSLQSILTQRQRSQDPHINSQSKAIQQLLLPPAQQPLLEMPLPAITFPSDAIELQTIKPIIEVASQVITNNACQLSPKKVTKKTVGACKKTCNRTLKKTVVFDQAPAHRLAKRTDVKGLDVLQQTKRFKDKKRESAKNNVDSKKPSGGYKKRKKQINNAVAVKEAYAEKIPVHSKREEEIRMVQNFYNSITNNTPRDQNSEDDSKNAIEEIKREEGLAMSSQTAASAEVKFLQQLLPKLHPPHTATKVVSSDGTLTPRVEDQQSQLNFTSTGLKTPISTKSQLSINRSHRSTRTVSRVASIIGTPALSISSSEASFFEKRKTCSKKSSNVVANQPQSPSSSSIYGTDKFRTVEQRLEDILEKRSWITSQASTGKTRSRAMSVVFNVASLPESIQDPTGGDGTLISKSSKTSNTDSKLSAIPKEVKAIETTHLYNPPPIHKIKEELDWKIELPYPHGMVIAEDRATRRNRVRTFKSRKEPIQYRYIKRMKRQPPNVHFPDYLGAHLDTKFRQTFTSLMRRDCSQRRMATMQLFQRLNKLPIRARSGINLIEMSRQRYKDNKTSHLRAKSLMKVYVTPEHVKEHLRKFRRPPFRSYVHIKTDFFQ